MRRTAKELGYKVGEIFVVTKEYGFGKDRGGMIDVAVLLSLLKMMGVQIPNSNISMIS